MHQARLPATPSSTGTVLRLTGARLIDGTGAAAVDNAEVLIDGDRIIYAGPARNTGDHPEATTVDLKGKTLLPGFIDTHVHLSLSLETPPAESAARFGSERVLAAARIIHDTLMAGITTARDLGGLDAGYRRAIASGTILGPRLHLAVAVLSPTGGHSDMCMPNGTNAMPHTQGMITVDSDDEMRRAVRTLIRSEADVIKICTTGGVSSPSDTPHDLGVPEHQVRLIKDETARRSGQPVAAHAQGTAGILEAIRGGVNSVEHGYEIDGDGIALMLEQEAFLVPTLSSALRVPDPANVPAYLYEKKVQWSGIAREHLGKALKAGVKVALGTDAGVCPHGENLKELAHLVELGLSPMDAIVAGTKHAAELMRLEDHLGTLQTGKLADLVITEIDPLTDITLMADPANIGAIIQGGRCVKDLKGWLPLPPTTTTFTAP
ncbi:metal-dependent hydrolase family protein [Arthrobacter crystallopoietes]|uniref:metal-dependent hydrolase family protein n=1 Tax=Crystallibacter crystallopoietes TaxID=37928 RepID=UPI00111124FB|nr:amidohydrolase family protein [Arthrobacter crystallopoietes]